MYKLVKNPYNQQINIVQKQLSKTLFKKKTKTIYELFIIMKTTLFIITNTN